MTRTFSRGSLWLLLAVAALVLAAGLSGVIPPPEHVLQAAGAFLSDSLGHIGSLSGVLAANTALIAAPEKSRRAAVFLAEADKLAARVSDPDVKLTKDELETAMQGIRDYKARAALVAEFTPSDEIQRQERAGTLRIGNRDGNGDGGAGGQPANEEDLDFRTAVEEIGKDINRYFGGPNSYILKLAQRAGRVYDFSEKQAQVHQRLEKLHQRAIIGTANDVSGGEFLLPLQQVASIFSVDVLQPSIIDIATRYPMAGRTLRIPIAQQTDASNKTRPMSGIANVGIIGEGSSKTEKTPAFNQRILTAYKIAAYTEIGDETLNDDFTGELSPTVQKLIGGQVMNYLGELCSYDGTGSSQPLGAFHTNNGALITVNRTTSQSVTTADVFSMYAKHTFGFGRSVWFANRTVLPALMALTLSGNTLVTWLQNLNAPPTMALLGLPVVLTDMAPVLGVQGDLALGNGGFYAYALRQALTVESSIHYKFQNDLTAFRFLTRGGGIPIPQSEYSYKASGSVKTAPHSPFVVLGDDLAS